MLTIPASYLITAVACFCAGALAAWIVPTAIIFVRYVW